MKVISLVVAVSLAFAFAACGAKSDLEGSRPIFDGTSDPVVEEAVNLPPEAQCPEDLYASPGKPRMLEGRGTDDGWIAGYLWEVESAPSGAAAAPSPAASPTTSFEPDLAGTGDAPLLYTLRLTVTDNLGLTGSCTCTVMSVEGPPIALCPEDQSIVSGETAVLEGDAYDDGYIVGYLWEIVDAPAEHGSHLEDAAKATSLFVSGIEDSGGFTLRLTVTDDEGLQDDCEVHVSVGGVPEAICPGDLEVPTRTTVTLEGAAEDDGTITAWSWACIENDTDTAPTLGTPAAQTTTFWALRVGHYTMQLSVTDDAGLSDTCTFVVTTTETPPTAICPADIETRPLTEVELVGAAEDDGEILRYDWLLVDKPVGSSAASPSPAMGRISHFTPDVAGEYTIRLTVTDDMGHQTSCEFKVIAQSGEGLRVEIYWNPPENAADTSDVDLHLLHPSAPAWEYESLDCYYANCDSRFYVLEWDAPGTDDNPRLDLDDVDGYGPENINIAIPVAQTYRVGIHYYDNDFWGDSQVYVKIYCGTITVDPVYEAGPRTLRAYGPREPMNDFWKVADVTWNGYSCSITPIDVVVTHEQALTER
jgi:hypothetical protein